MWLNCDGKVNNHFGLGYQLMKILTACLMRLYCEMYVKEQEIYFQCKSVWIIHSVYYILFNI